MVGGARPNSLCLREGDRNGGDEVGRGWVIRKAFGERDAECAAIARVTAASESPASRTNVPSVTRSAWGGKVMGSSCAACRAPVSAERILSPVPVMSYGIVIRGGVQLPDKSDFQGLNGGPRYRIGIGSLCGKSPSTPAARVLLLDKYFKSANRSSRRITGLIKTNSV